jgi:hypothetical protein
MALSNNDRQRRWRKRQDAGEKVVSVTVNYEDLAYLWRATGFEGWDYASFGNAIERLIRLCQKIDFRPPK